LNARARAHFAPRIVAFACTTGALATVCIDAFLHSDPARLCVGLPLALALAVLTYVPACGLAAALEALHARAWALPLWAGALTLLVGAWLSNVLLVDMPRDPLTMVGYACSIALASAATAVTRRRWRGLPMSRVTLALCALCILFLGVDAHASPVQYPLPHALLRLVIAAGLTATVLLYGVPRRAPATSIVTLALLGILACLPLGVIRTAIFASATFEKFAVSYLLRSAARPLVMRAFGIHACDFSGVPVLLQVPCPRERVVLDWAEGSAPLRLDESVPPTKLVLLTVDAFRCGAHERHPFQDACPVLARYGARPGARIGSLRVSYPATTPALLDLHRGEYEASLVGDRASWLAGNLDARGFPGVAVATHRQLQIEPVIRSFVTWDDTLRDRVAQPAFLSSPAISARVLEHLRPLGQRFVWAHYYDPHDPYVPASGGHVTWSDSVAYVAELGRTDTAIGTLLDSIEAGSEPTIVAVTGDHGEGFGEHGATHHGYELYDNAIRVPWVAVPFHGAALPPESPRQNIDVASWFGAAAGGPAFHAQPPRPARTPKLWSLTDGRHKVILDRENGWLELYDLEADPRETRNIAATSMPLTMRMLSGLLAIRR
jgi:hypothetical protein